MAKRGRDARLTPSDLPLEPPDALRLKWEEAKEAVTRLREAEREVSRRRGEATVIVERYELALLEHRGQMKLFGDSDEQA